MHGALEESQEQKGVLGRVAAEVLEVTRDGTRDSVLLRSPDTGGRVN